MPKLRIGSIPDKITYVTRQPIEVRCGWYDLPDVYFSTPKLVVPTFPVDPASKTQMATAIRWTNDEKCKYRRVIETDNAPMKWVQVVTLELRAEGGRAYKVMLPNEVSELNLYVDLREDILLDALLQNGCGKGGVLKGPFVWARLGSQLRLVRVGSELHVALAEAKERNATKPLAPKTWVPGTVYLTRTNKELVFLGYYDTDVFEHRVARGPRADGRYGDNEIVTYKEHRHAPLWLDLNYFGRRYKTGGGEVPQTAQERYDYGLHEREPYIGAFKVVKTPVLISAAGTVDVGAFVDKAHTLAAHYLTRERRQLVGYPNLGTLAYGSVLANLRAPGEPRAAPPEYERLWAVGTKDEGKKRTP